MMRVVRLILLGLLAYVVSVVWLFPAAPVVEKIRPDIQPVQLTGVSGKLFNGQVDNVLYNDDIMPLALENVQWRFMPRKLFAAAAGVNFSFDAYGGSGHGDFARHLSGDMSLTDVDYKGPAKGFEALLPLPIAEFSGDLAVDINNVRISNQLLQTLDGDFRWKNATLETPIPAFLGDIVLVVEPAGENNHRGIIEAKGGEVELDGTVELALNGDFLSDVMVTPTESASPELINALRTFARPASDGRYRVQRNGNVNRLM